MLPNDLANTPDVHFDSILQGPNALGKKPLGNRLRTLNDTGDGFVFVATDADDKLLGVAVGTMNTPLLMQELFNESAPPELAPPPDLDPRRVGCFLSIQVHPSADRAAVAEALFGAMLDEFLGRGAELLLGNMPRGSQHSIAEALFRSSGFERTDNTDVLRLNLAPAMNEPSPKLDVFCTDPDRIGRMWYTPPAPLHHPGWRLFSEDYVLESLQGCLNDPDSVRRTPGQLMLARLVLAVMSVAQAFLMAISLIPLVSSWYYSLAAAMPRNSLGFFLRGCYWKPRLRRLGVDTLIDQYVEFTRPERIEIGSRVHVDRGVLMVVAAGGGYIRVGNNTSIGAGGHIAGRGGVWIGDFVGLSPLVHIYSVTNQPYSLERRGELITMSHMAPVNRQAPFVAPVRIEDHSVIGYGTILHPGVAIGRAAIVHSFAEVRNTLPPYAVATGHGTASRNGWRRPGAIDPRIHQGRFKPEPESKD